MDIEPALIDIGLSKNEAKIYISLASLGEATANQIAQNSKIHRTNVYDSLQKLIENGFASYIYREGTKYYKTTDPENLLLVMDEKKRKLENILPMLRFAGIKKAENTAEIIEGVKGFCWILENFLNYKDEILGLGIPEIVPGKVKHFIPGFHKRRIAKGIPMKHLYSFHAKERIEYLNTLPLTEATYLEEKFDSKVVTNICGDEVVFTLWTDDLVWSVRVVNKEMANSYKRYFYVLYEQAKQKNGMNFKNQI